MDWIYLPLNTEEQTLYGCLHDGELLSCVSNKLERNVTLVFSVRHLLEESEENLEFIFKLDDVTSMRANIWFKPVEKFVEIEGITREERGDLVREYQAKFHEESINWSDFESALETDPLQITDADFVSKDNDFSLTVEGFLDGEKYNNQFCSIFLRGGNLTVSRSDNENFSLDELRQRGANYWNSFGED